MLVHVASPANPLSFLTFSSFLISLSPQVVPPFSPVRELRQSCHSPLSPARLSFFPFQPLSLSPSYASLYLWIVISLFPFKITTSYDMETPVVDLTHALAGWLQRTPKWGEAPSQLPIRHCW